MSSAVCTASPRGPFSVDPRARFRFDAIPDPGKVSWHGIDVRSTRRMAPDSSSTPCSRSAFVLAEELQVGLKAATVTQRERPAPASHGMLTSSSGL
jgi:hypothetical protein